MRDLIRSLFSGPPKTGRRPQLGPADTDEKKSDPGDLYEHRPVSRFEARFRPFGTVQTPPVYYSTARFVDVPQYNVRLFLQLSPYVNSVTPKATEGMVVRATHVYAYFMSEFQRANPGVDPNYAELLLMALAVAAQYAAREFCYISSTAVKTYAECAGRRPLSEITFDTMIPPMLRELLSVLYPAAPGRREIYPDCNPVQACVYDSVNESLRHFLDVRDFSVSDPREHPDAVHIPRHELDASERKRRQDRIDRLKVAYDTSEVDYEQLSKRLDDLLKNVKRNAQARQEISMVSLDAIHAEERAHELSVELKQAERHLRDFERDCMVRVHTSGRMYSALGLAFAHPPVPTTEWRLSVNRVMGPGGIPLASGKMRSPTLEELRHLPFIQNLINAIQKISAASYPHNICIAWSEYELAVRFRNALQAQPLPSAALQARNGLLDPDRILPQSEERVRDGLPYVKFFPGELALARQSVTAPAPAPAPARAPAPAPAPARAPVAARMPVPAHVIQAVPVLAARRMPARAPRPDPVPARVIEASPLLVHRRAGAPARREAVGLRRAREGSSSDESD